MPRPLLIDDGYTWEKALTRPQVWLRYRPALMDELVEYHLACKESPTDATISLLKRHILRWDIKGDDGRVTKVSKKTLRRLAYPLVQDMVGTVLGYPVEEQITDLANLRVGLRLLLWHPLWANRSCDDCEKYLYDEDGQITRRPARIGLPVLRLPGQPTPCYSCPKIAETERVKSRLYATELSERTRAAYGHYMTCLSLGGHFPEDPIVRRNASVIFQVREAWLKGQQDRLYFLLGGKL